MIPLLLLAGLIVGMAFAIRSPRDYPDPDPREWSRTRPGGCPEPILDPDLESQLPEFSRITFMENASRLFLSSLDARARGDLSSLEGRIPANRLTHWSRHHQPADPRPDHPIDRGLDQAHLIQFFPWGLERAAVNVDFHFLHTIAAHDGSTPRTRGAERWSFSITPRGFRVHEVTTLARRPWSPRPPETWLPTAEGTPVPTRVAPRFEVGRRQFMRRHPEFSWRRFCQHLQEIFLEVEALRCAPRTPTGPPGPSDPPRPAHDHPSGTRHEGSRSPACVGDLERERITARRRDRDWAGHRLHAPARITRIVPVDVTPDTCFEILRVRIYTEGPAWVEDKAGVLLAGDRDAPRKASQYWTLVVPAGTPVDGPETGGPTWTLVEREPDEIAHPL